MIDDICIRHPIYIPKTVSNNHKLSIIYITYRPGGMDVLCNSLKRQTYKDYELIVVDDYPNRDLKEYFDGNGIPITYYGPSKEKHYKDTPFGQVNAFNTGILKATGEKNKDLVLYEGDVLDSNLVKRVFQEIYWGIDMFPRVYNEKNKFCFKPGKVHKEMLIADRLLLKKLSEKKDVVLSIVTGREKFDAEYSLEKYDIRKFFSNIITLTDIKDKKFKKPDPYCLNLLETQIKKPIKQRFYVGDQIDDIKMVNSVRKDYDIKGIGFLYNPKDLETRELFKKNKADYVVDNWRNLGEILVG